LRDEKIQPRSSRSLEAIREIGAFKRIPYDLELFYGVAHAAILLARCARLSASSLGEPLHSVALRDVSGERSYEPERWFLLSLVLDVPEPPEIVLRLGRHAAGGSARSFLIFH